VEHVQQSEDSRQGHPAASSEAGPWPDDFSAELAAIGTWPLDERAAAYVRLHDRLRDELEGGDVPRATNA
jgi:hypothetical protein